MKFENYKAPKLTNQEGRFPKEFPYKPEDFKRADESDDAIFYSVPRFTYHIDESAVQALTDFYA